MRRAREAKYGRMERLNLAGWMERIWMVEATEYGRMTWTDPKNLRYNRGMNTNRYQEYRPRVMDSEIEQCLQAYGAVCIEGPKSSGKTWAAARHAQSAIYLTDPSQNFANRSMTDISLDYALNGTRPHLIDEWQEVPELWDAVRFKVDETTKKGQFLLTGSSTPVVKGVLHSGAGRIVRLRMRPMSLYESGDSTGEASLHAICTGADIPVLFAETSIERLAQLIVRGGWPETLALPYEAGARFARDYMNTIIHHDLPRLEETRRDIQKVELLLRSLARNESTTASIRTLCRDVEAREGESLGRDTASQYLSVLDRLFLLDNQEPFGFGDRAAARLKSAEKRHFVSTHLWHALCWTLLLKAWWRIQERLGSCLKPCVRGISASMRNRSAAGCGTIRTIRSGRLMP